MKPDEDDDYDEDLDDEAVQKKPAKKSAGGKNKDKPKTFIGTMENTGCKFVGKELYNCRHCGKNYLWDDSLDFDWKTQCFGMARQRIRQNAAYK